MLVLVEQKAEHYIFNPLMCDELVDVTLYKNYKILMNSHYIMSFRKDSEELYADIMMPFFLMADHCLLEKSKALAALDGFKDVEKTESKNLDELLKLKQELALIINKDVVYDFGYIMQEVSAETFWNCIARKYVEELERVYNRIEYEVAYKENKLREKQQAKFNIKVQLLTLILAIPSINTVVDVFYEINWKYPIFFPKAFAKLIWMIIAILFILIYLRSKDNKLEK